MSEWMIDSHPNSPSLSISLSTNKSEWLADALRAFVILDIAGGVGIEIGRLGVSVILIDIDLPSQWSFESKITGVIHRFELDNLVIDHHEIIKIIIGVRVIQQGIVLVPLLQWREYILLLIVLVLLVLFLVFIL